MLGKLIKHEFKSTYKMCGLMLVIVLVVSLIGVVGFSLPLDMLITNEEVMDQSIVGVIWVLTMVVSMMLYIFTLIGVMYAIIIYLGVRFYKSMYSDEGYLTQTLPVTSHQLLLGKTLTAGLWYLLLEIAIAVSVFALIFTVLNSAGMFTGLSLRDFWGEMLSEGFGMMESEMGVSLIGYLGYTLVLFLIQPFATMLMLFGSVTIGQLAKKHKAMMGILTYFGVMVVQMILSYIISIVFTIGTALSVMEGGIMNPMGAYIPTSVLTVLISAAMYFIAHYVLSRKLNMD